jgi:hypothetical protein
LHSAVLLRGFLFFFSRFLWMENSVSADLLRVLHVLGRFHRSGVRRSAADIDHNYVQFDGTIQQVARRVCRILRKNDNTITTAYIAHILRILSRKAIERHPIVAGNSCVYIDYDAPKRVFKCAETKERNLGYPGMRVRVLWMLVLEAEADVGSATLLRAHRGWWNRLTS